MEKVKTSGPAKEKPKAVNQDITPEESLTPLGGMHIAWMIAVVIIVNLMFFPAKKKLIDHTPHWAEAPASIIKDSIMARIDTVKPQVMKLEFQGLAKNLALCH